MDFRQRFLTALAHEEPDRVPLMGMILDTAKTNQVLGKAPKDVIALLRKPLLRPILKGLMNNTWFWNRMYYGTASDILESAARLGFDANWTISFRMRLEADADNALGLVFHDAWGRVWELAPDGRGGMTTNYSRGLCSTVNGCRRPTDNPNYANPYQNPDLPGCRTKYFFETLWSIEPDFRLP